MARVLNGTMLTEKCKWDRIRISTSVGASSASIPTDTGLRLSLREDDRGHRRAECTLNDVLVVRGFGFKSLIHNSSDL